MKLHDLASALASWVIDTVIQCSTPLSQSVVDLTLHTFLKYLK